MVHGIIKNHGFVDANKRTAYYLVDLLAERSDYEIVASDEAVTDMFVSVANGETGYEELAIWFRNRLQRQE
ncbi:MAG: type II toxin-antitoxin system death-on-curing family toxin [Rhodobacteraceae bacterium]|nr:type II toxin-antitoxin system death-on-curing family toxin [Paracoccaceae bacterium]